MEDFPALVPPPGSIGNNAYGRQQQQQQQQQPIQSRQTSFVTGLGHSAASVVSGVPPQGAQGQSSIYHQQTLARIIQQGGSSGIPGQQQQQQQRRGIPNGTDVFGEGLADKFGQGRPNHVEKLVGTPGSDNSAVAPGLGGAIHDGSSSKGTNETIPVPPAGTETSFGIYGLVDILRMTNSDTSMLSLGYDFMNLGLNLNSESLCETFMSPFAQRPTLGADPQFKVPGFYNLQHPPPQPVTKVASFSDETLFYIFYAMPRETLQEVAAQELYNRNWRFHKDLKLWLSKDINTETVKGLGGEKGVFIFFDPATWSRVKKEWVIFYDQLEERYSASTAENGENYDNNKSEVQTTKASDDK